MAVVQLAVTVKHFIPVAPPMMTSMGLQPCKIKYDYDRCFLFFYDGEMVYISGINYLYEFDFGDLSGWVYHVNGVSPSVGCGEYKLSDGDRIEWLYTCNLGNDLK